MTYQARSRGVAIANLMKARRIARTIPGADIHDDLDALLRTVYSWTESGGRHVKLFQCGEQSKAMEFARLVRDFMRASEVLGSSQLYSDGRIFVDYWADRDSTMGRRIDALYNEFIGVDNAQ